MKRRHWLIVLAVLGLIGLGFLYYCYKLLREPNVSEGVLIEIHTHPMPPHRGGPDGATLWARSEPWTFDGFGLRRPTPLDQETRGGGVAAEVDVALADLPPSLGDERGPSRSVVESLEGPGTRGDPDDVRVG